MLVKPGIYVAFDRFGEHFRYARHPDNQLCIKQSQEQQLKVEALKEEAQRRGGKVMLLSLDEFDSLILRNIRPENSPPADGDVAA